MKSKKIFKIIFVLILVSLPLITIYSSGFSNPLKTSDLKGLVEGLIDAVIKIGAVLTVLAFIYTGFLFVTANGEDKKIDKAKNSLKWSAVGALVLLGSKVISEVIQSTVEKIEK
jgi:ABC-type amino acid transport system permease subunit